MNCFLTLGVIVKNIIHYILKIYSKNSSIYICSIIFSISCFIFILVFNIINFYFPDESDSDLEDLFEYEPNLTFFNNKNSVESIEIELTEERNKASNNRNINNIEAKNNIKICDNNAIKNNNININDDINNNNITNTNIYINNNNNNNLINSLHRTISNKEQKNDENDIDNKSIISTSSYDNIHLDDYNGYEAHKRVKELINIDRILHKKRFYSSDFFCCFLKISFDEFLFLIKIKSFTNYLLTLIGNPKFRAIMCINLFSRLQKLKFKQEYKNDFNGLIIFHAINFFLSYFVSFSLLIFYYYSCFKKDSNIKNINLRQKERYIIIIIGCVCFSMIILSLCAFTGLSCFNFLGICISGNINFFFYEYYSTQEIEYTSLSGYISIGQLIFRACEFINFKNIYWYLGQILCSFLAIYFCLYY